jgi:hypothetical protein
VLPTVFPEVQLQRANFTIGGLKDARHDQARALLGRFKLTSPAMQSSSCQSAGKGACTSCGKLCCSGRGGRFGHCGAEATHRNVTFELDNLCSNHMNRMPFLFRKSPKSKD